MRVIGGEFKGRTIEVPKNFRGRPTTDFAREGLFNMLNHMVDWESSVVLDLFAGTGAFSIECASRGCPKVTAVELDATHVRFISRNFQQFNLKSAAVVRADVFKFLGAKSGTFDVIFADPPFDHPHLRDLPPLVLQNNFLNPEGLFILEHPPGFDFASEPGFLKHRSYGQVNFTFFRT